MTESKFNVQVRKTTYSDIEGIIRISQKVYPESIPWKREQLESHLKVFPEGQLVAVLPNSQVIGMAASLIILWDQYEMEANWRDFTDSGFFRNHDPEHGRTLYGAEIMVDPDYQGGGVGSKIYQSRQQLAERLGLLRIRAGARLRGYHRYAREYSPNDYTVGVIRGEIRDPTLSFQLNRDFQVLAVVSGYLRHDAESLGYAAVIEWLNPAVAKPEDYAGRNPIFL